MKIKEEIDEGASGSELESDAFQASYAVVKQFMSRPLNFTNLDGVHTGVPTATTPTITPTTLRNIEQTFIELQRETAKRPEHIYEAGFVPPPIDPVTVVQGNNNIIANNNNKTFVNLVDNRSWLGGSTTISTVTPPPTTVNMQRQIPVSASHLPLVQVTTPPPPAVRRNVGGRRPNKNYGLSPEEEERRHVRRERNKMAAARCRKRRLDHTNELCQEVEELELKKANLQKQIQAFQGEKEQLEFILEAHTVNCRLGVESPPSPPELKPVIFMEDGEPRVLVQQQPTLHQLHHQPRLDAATLTSHQNSHRRPQLGATAGGMKPSRPNSLQVATKPLEIAGVPITTPSSVLPFNFDSLMEGGTGLTPVGLTPVSRDGFSPLIPSCSRQQRNDNDTISPDSILPPKLVSL